MRLLPVALAAIAKDYKTPVPINRGWLNNVVIL